MIDAAMINTGEIRASVFDSTLAVIGPANTNDGLYSAVDGATLLLANANIDGTGRFQANGQSDQVGADAGAIECFGADRRVCHRGRMTHETLDAAQRFRQRKILQRIQECTYRGVTACQPNTQHAAKAALLFQRYCMSRVIR